MIRPMLWAVVASPMVVATLARADAVDTVVIALIRGLEAEARHDNRELRKATSLLDASGAQPIDPRSDPAASWPRPRAAPYRERVLGPAYLRLSLASGASYRLEQSFFGGRQAQVAVNAVHAIPAELSVEQDGTKLPCPAAGPAVSCRWLPLYTGRVTIQLINRGERSDDFVLVMQ